MLMQTGKTRAVGIVGIERKIEEKRKETDKNITEVQLTVESKNTFFFRMIKFFDDKIDSHC